MDHAEKENIIIIGGGPSGLAAAIYNARAFLKPLVIAGSPPGGQLTLTSEVENYPGFLSIQGPELVDKMRKHAEHFGTRFIDENVARVDFTDKDNLKIFLNSGKELTAKSVLIATGASAKWIGLDSEAKLRGRGVSACATCDGFFFKDKVVAVVGGGDTAMEDALTLTKFAEKIYLIHRRGEFRASKIMAKRVMEHPKIQIIWNTQVVEVVGDQRVEGVKLEFLNEEAKKQLPSEALEVQGLFVAIGHNPNTNFLEGSGILLNEKKYILTASWYAWSQAHGNEEFKKDYDELLASGKSQGYNYHYQYSTTQPGVFAAGDVVDYLYRQGASAVGMGVAASLEVERYLAGIEEE